MRFWTANRWWPGRSLYAATLMLTDEAYVMAALRIPHGNCDPVAAHSPVGDVVMVGASPPRRGACDLAPLHACLARALA
jgi:hypothetical protein